MVAGTAGDDAAFGEAPDADEVVLAACEGVFAVGGEADAGEGAVVGGVEVDELFFEVIYYSEAAVFGDDGEVAGVGGEGEGGDAVVGDFPAGDWVCLLVFGVYGLVYVQGCQFAGGIRGIEIGWFGAVRGVGVGWFGGEGCVVAFFVVDDQGAVHVGGEEEVLRAGEPADRRDG